MDIQEVRNADSLMPAIFARFIAQDWAIFVGALLLIVGVFLPIAHIPIVGSLDYIQSGRGDGTIVLVLGVSVIGLVFGKLRLPAAIIGMAAVGIMLYTMTGLWGVVAKAQSDAAELAKDNPFGGLALAFASNMGLEWGWLPLLGGALLIIWGGLAAPRRPKPSVEVSTNIDPDAVVERYLIEHSAQKRPGVVQLRGPVNHAGATSQNSFGRRRR